MVCIKTNNKINLTLRKMFKKKISMFQFGIKMLKKTEICSTAFLAYFCNFRATFNFDDIFWEKTARGRKENLTKKKGLTYSTYNKKRAETQCTF